MKKKIMRAILAWAIAGSVMTVSADNQLFTFDDGTGYYIEDVNHLYPETGLVTEMETIDEETWLLTITVANGNQFQCYTEVCDWFLNDIASMLMDSKGTPEVYDDEIILCQYSGVIKFLEQHLVPEEE